MVFLSGFILWISSDVCVCVYWCLHSFPGLEEREIMERNFNWPLRILISDTSWVRSKLKAAEHMTCPYCAAPNNPNNPDKPAPRLALINSVAAHYLQLLGTAQLGYKFMSQVFLGFKFQEQTTWMKVKSFLTILDKNAVFNGQPTKERNKNF